MTSAKETRQQRYKQTEKGKEKQREAQERYAQTDHGRVAIERARSKHESSEERKAYRAAWMREYRRRLKEQQKESA